MMVNAANAIRPNTDMMMPLDQLASDCSWLGQLTKPHAANSKPITARITPNTVNGHSIKVKSMQEKSRSRTARFSNAEP